MSGEGGQDERYGLGELLAAFGDRWAIEPRRYLDGERLTAVPRPPVEPFIPIAARTPAEMRDRLLAEEGSRRA